MRKSASFVRNSDGMHSDTEIWHSEGRQRKYPHGFALLECLVDFTSDVFHHNAAASTPMKWANIEDKKEGHHENRILTSSIAGSSGISGGFGCSFSLGPFSILKSLTSLPRKTMYS